MPRLIDADALVKYIEETKCEWNEKTAPISWNHAYDSFVDFVDEQPTVSGWISVKDELPDAAGLGVLVNAVNRFGQDSIFIAFQGYGDFKWYTMDATKMAGDKDNSVNEAWKITHWMPILPPKEGI